MEAKCGSILKGIRVIKKNSNFQSEAYVKFQHGIFVMENLTNKILLNIINEYDIGIPNMFVRFAYMDYDRLVYFHCNIWDCEQNILDEIIKGFDDDFKKYVTDLLDGIKPTAKVDNIGFSIPNQMNSLVIDSHALVSPKAEYHGFQYAGAFINDIGKSDKEFKTVLGSEYDTMWVDEDFMEAVKDSFILLKQNVMVIYCSDWHNEGWNGPQNYRGYTKIGCNITDVTISDYECPVCFDENDKIWDKNTILTLSGNQSNDIKIYCRLQDISLFSGISEKDITDSDISDEIKSLMSVTYTKNDSIMEISNKFISIKNLLEVFEKKAYADNILQNKCSECRIESKSSNGVLELQDGNIPF